MCHLEAQYYDYDRMAMAEAIIRGNHPNDESKKQFFMAYFRTFLAGWLAGCCLLFHNKKEKDDKTNESPIVGYYFKLLLLSIDSYCLLMIKAIITFFSLK